MNKDKESLNIKEEEQSRLNNNEENDKKEYNIKIKKKSKYFFFVFIITINIQIYIIINKIIIFHKNKKNNSNKNYKNIFLKRFNVNNSNSTLLNYSNYENNKYNESINESNINNVSKVYNLSNIHKEKIGDNIKISKDILNNIRMGRNFLDKCLEGALINDNNLEEVNTPKISIIIPLYNCNDTIKFSLRSVQNQNIKDIEIILVNDFSQDNTLNIVEELKKEDKRIKLINNNKNMGVLYSRSIGALKAEGKYIFALDHDDMFLYHDIISKMSEKAEKENFDVIAFCALSSQDYYSKIHDMHVEYFHRKKNNLVVKQPSLSIYSISRVRFYYLNDPHIWGKCINATVYKIAVNTLGKERYSEYNSWNEDITMIFMIYNFAKNYKFIREKGIYHHSSHKTASYTTPSSNKMTSEINFIEIILDFAKDKYKYFSALKAIHLKNFWLYDISDIKVKNHLALVLKKILNSTNINQPYKDKIKSIYKNII